MQSGKQIEISRDKKQEIKVILDEATRTTNAQISLFDGYGNVVLTSRGKARWNPIDYFDPEIGKTLALGRAMEKYGRKLANLAKQQSCSPGEYRARIKRDQIIQEFGEVFYRQFSKPHPTTSYNSDEENPTPKLDRLIRSEDAPRQPKKAESGQEIGKVDYYPDLQTITESNKEKLTAKEGAKGTHK